MGDVTIIMTAMCCGYGKMCEDESARQIVQGVRDYADYRPDTDAILVSQPRYYMNSEFFDIAPGNIEPCY